MNNLKIALITVFEPDNHFVEFLKSLKEANFEVLVINDGSQVTFNKIFEEAGKIVRILNHEFNRGMGASIKTGLEYIKKNCQGNYIVVTMDYHKKQEIEDIKQVSEAVLLNPNAFVLGSKRRTKETSITTKLGSEAMRFAYQKKTGIDVYDTNANLRGFSNNLIDFLLQVKGNRKDYEINVLLKCAEQKIEIKEIALTEEEKKILERKEKKKETSFESEIFKFAMLSPFGLGIDFVLFLILYLFSKQGMVSLVFAKIVSSIIDFSRDKTHIYKIEPDASKVTKLYCLFVFLIILVDCLLFGFLSSFFSLQIIFAKIVGEIAVYAVCLGIREGFPEPDEKKNEKL